MAFERQVIKYQGASRYHDKHRGKDIHPPLSTTSQSICITLPMRLPAHDQLQYLSAARAVQHQGLYDSSYTSQRFFACVRGCVHVCVLGTLQVLPLPHDESIVSRKQTISLPAHVLHFGIADGISTPAPLDCNSIPSSSLKDNKKQRISCGNRHRIWHHNVPSCHCSLQ